jgi:putative transposase
MWRFEVSPRRATPKGLPSSFAQHRIPRGTYLHPAPLSLRSWHTDITYIRTWEGFLYLATVIDCHSKAVLGWAMADHYRTGLIKDAIRMAAGTGLLQPGAVVHSDRGSNYTSDEFGRFLAGLRIHRSVGRTGVCYDNAMAESFFSAIKNEWLHRFVFTTRGREQSSIPVDQNL